MYGPTRADRIAPQKEGFTQIFGRCSSNFFPPDITYLYQAHCRSIFIVFKSINPHIEYFKTGEKRSKWASLPSISKFLIGDFGVVKTQPNW
jgi:hypothetical protein